SQKRAIDSPFREWRRRGAVCRLDQALRNGRLNEITLPRPSSVAKQIPTRQDAIRHRASRTQALHTAAHTVGAGIRQASDTANRTASLHTAGYNYLRTRPAAGCTLSHTWDTNPTP